MWGFIAAAIMPTVAPIIAKNLGWTQVLLVNAGVILVAVVGYLLTNSNKQLRTV